MKLPIFNGLLFLFIAKGGADMPHQMIETDISENCPPGYTTPKTHIGSFCYKVYSSRQTNTKASVQCNLDNGNLVSVADQTEDMYIYNLASEAKVDEVWLGSKCYNGMKACENDDNTPFAYSNFGHGGPDPLETCVAMISTGPESSRWRTADCNNAYAFVCEVPQGSKRTTPAPTTRTTQSPTPQTTTRLPTTTTTTMATTSKKPKIGKCEDSSWSLSTSSKQDPEPLCFKVFLFKKYTSLADSEKTCNNVGAKLAPMRSNSEKEAIYDSIKKSNMGKGWAASLLIGLVDVGPSRDVAPDFRWVFDGSKLGNTTYWIPGQPDRTIYNGSYEKCVELAPWQNLEWNDVSCSAYQIATLQGVLCAKEPQF